MNGHTMKFKIFLILQLIVCSSANASNELNEFYHNVGGRPVCNYMKIINGRAAHDLGHKGHGATVAVIDTDFNQFQSDLHGVRVTNIINTIAPNATVLQFEIGEVLCSGGKGALSHTIMTAADQPKVDIINISLTYGYNSKPYQRGEDLWRALEYATSRNKVISFSFGNHYKIPKNTKWMGILAARYDIMTNTLEDLVKAPAMRGLIRLVVNASYRNGENINQHSNRSISGCRYVITAPGTEMFYDPDADSEDVIMRTNFCNAVFTGAYAIVKGIFPKATPRELLEIIDISARFNKWGTNEVVRNKFGVGVIDIKAATKLAMDRKFQHDLEVEIILRAEARERSQTRWRIIRKVSTVAFGVVDSVLALYSWLYRS